MAQFMDVHTGMKDLTREQLREAHQKDLENERKEKGVHFIKAWADPRSGKVFCLSEGPSKDAVQRVHQASGHAADEIYEVPLTVE
ncbi:MAG: SCO4226 family nickel-binding protein [Myxococcales bacterium]|nr:SCO4226 family nickel-binding protein [Myxococcales bacterium]